MRRPRNIAEARAVQEELKKRLRLVPLRKKIRLLAAADAAFLGDLVLASACLFSYPDLNLVDEKCAVMKTEFPYIPGYLAFREGPAVLRAVAALSEKPDLLMLDGQGIAHPRGMGIASHVGVLLDMPTIGCAKSRLVGEYREPGRRKGSHSVLRFNRKVVGTALRTRDGARVIFVSPGHRTDVSDSLRITLACLRGYRVPEPTRCADLKTKELKRRYAAQGQILREHYL